MGHQRYQQQRPFSKLEPALRLIKRRPAPTGTPKMSRQPGIQGSGQKMH